MHSQSNSPALELTMALIERASLTPDDAGCQTLIAERLKQKGFSVQSLPFGQVNNLWATHTPRSSSNASHAHSPEPVLCFIGHTDVVPPGDLSQWDSPPFEPTIRDGFLYGRGAADMKSGLACMITAAEAFVDQNPHHAGTIALLITSDEEGPALHGTRAVVEHFKKINQKITWAIVGEASSEKIVGDTLKNGRRGSLNGELIIHGKQGHIAYPDLANNPIHLALPALTALSQTTWDEGTDDFPPTRFQISNIGAGTGADNVIPGALKVLFNLRFSPSLTPETIQPTIEKILKKHNLNYTLNWRLSGLPFITDKNKPLIQATQSAVEEIMGLSPKLSTSGGTSDGRFIATLGAEVIELGPINASIHQINECVTVEDLDKLTNIYIKILEKLF